MVLLLVLSVTTPFSSSEQVEAGCFEILLG